MSDVGTDIDEFKRRLAELQISDEELRMLFDHARDQGMTSLTLDRLRWLQAHRDKPVRT